MSKDHLEASQPANVVRERRKEEVRTRIADEVISLMVEGGIALNHDNVATRAGVARRTVYRYFPDRDALMHAAWVRVRERAGPQVVMPKTMDELLATLEPIYTGFDKTAAIATVVRSTPEGRALRLSAKVQRIESYTDAAAEAVRDLPDEDARLATAMFQVLHTTPWLELRDHWDLDGRQIARVTGWAIRALLADLKARGSRPLGDDLPCREQS